MSTTLNTKSSIPSKTPSPEATARLAHELSNLLDGSLRNLSLVMSMMRGGGGANSDAATQQADEDLLLRLQTAENGMRHMATMIRQFQQPASGTINSNPTNETLPVRLDHAASTVDQVIEQACNLYRPAAHAVNIQIRTQIALEAACLPGGPLYQVLANALRNSIEAITADAKQVKDRRIDIYAEVGHGMLRLIITDNGPGLSPKVLDVGGKFRVGKTTKPGGQGIGTTTCNEVAEGLGGTMRLANRPGERGAVLTVSIPVDRIAREAVHGR